MFLSLLIATILIAPSSVTLAFAQAPSVLGANWEAVNHGPLGGRTIGIGVAIIVIAGVLLSRRKKV